MKAVSTLWNYPNDGATNESGFTGLPGGFRYSNGAFYFDNAYTGRWWSSSLEFSNTAILYYLLAYDSIAYKGSEYFTFGASVRCIKD